MRTPRHLVVVAVAALAAGTLAGCATEPGPFAPLDTTKFTLENTDKFVLLDKPAQYSVTCTGLQERQLGAALDQGIQGVIGKPYPRCGHCHVENDGAQLRAFRHR